MYTASERSEWPWSEGDQRGQRGMGNVIGRTVPPVLGTSNFIGKIADVWMKQAFNT
jgi:hypothetical protein